MESYFNVARSAGRGFWLMFVAGSASVVGCAGYWLSWRGV